ncbi:hypothetical protein QIA36_04955 (plasmid) [Borreliella yangtzensis]
MKIRIKHWQEKCTQDETKFGMLTKAPKYRTKLRTKALPIFLI